MRSSVSLQSWKNFCSSHDAASACVRVSIISRRSVHASLIPSFHSAIVAASECPAAISWSQMSLTAATRSWPISSVSCANSLNRSHSICKQIQEPHEYAKHECIWICITQLNHSRCVLHHVRHRRRWDLLAKIVRGAVKQKYRFS